MKCIKKIIFTMLLNSVEFELYMRAIDLDTAIYKYKYYSDKIKELNQ